MGTVRIPVYDIKVKDNENLVTSLSYYSVGIIVHNCQDTNEMTMNIFEQLPGKKVIVGDTHQAIYGFNGAVNAMDKFNNVDKSLLNINLACSVSIFDNESNK